VTSFFGVWFLYNMLMYVIMVLLSYNLVYHRNKFYFKESCTEFSNWVLISASLLRIISFLCLFYSIISKFKGVSSGLIEYK